MNLLEKIWFYLMTIKMIIGFILRSSRKILSRKMLTNLSSSSCSEMSSKAAFLVNEEINQAVYEKICPLFEDDSIILVDKAPNMFSVPGKEAHPFVKFRNDEWQDAVEYAAKALSEIPISECQKIIRLLAQTKTGICRNERKFYPMIQKMFHVKDIALQKLVYQTIVDADTKLNSLPFDQIPKHLMSTFDLVENYCGHRMFVVHRLDMETSGVIMFAKTQAANIDLSRQFRDREVNN